MKARVQHPKVPERPQGRDGPWWSFRYWADEVQPDGSVRTVRMAGTASSQVSLSKS